MLPSDVFKRDVPPEYLKAVAAGLRDCYWKAGMLCERLFGRREERFNTYPWVRRGLVEQMLRETAADFAGAVTVSAERDSFWYHVQIGFGEVLLTQSACADENSFVRPAIYKERLAVEMQGLLFPDSNTPPEGAKIWAALMHGRQNGDDLRQLGFAVIRFPRPSLRGYHDGEIDLFEAFEDVLLDVPSPDAEIVPDDAFPQLLDGSAQVSGHTGETIEDVARPRLLNEEEHGS